MCDECLKKIPLNEGKLCVKCGKPIYDESEYCLVCQNNDRFFDNVASPFIYKDKIEKLIINYKFYNNRFLAKYFVSFMVDKYINEFMQADVIVPVPIRNKVLDERTFSQTELLAKELSTRLKIPLDCKTLIKIKDTKHQAKLGGKDRESNIKGAFDLVDKSFKDKKVLVIDDILTTGSTLSEIAKTIKKARPESVYGLTLANAEYKPFMELKQ